MSSLDPRFVRAFRNGTLSEEQVAEFAARDPASVQLQLQLLELSAAPPTLPACPTCDGELTRTGRTRTRIVEVRDDWLEFAKPLRRIFTDAAAEREIRPAVVMRKVSFGSTSEQGDATDQDEFRGLKGYTPTIAV